jgi:hypothetical protein
MQNIDIEIARKSWREAPDSHIDQAINNIKDYDTLIKDIIIEEAEKRFGKTFVLETLNDSTQQGSSKREYGGIRRREFFFGWLGLLVFNAVLGLVFQGNEIIYLSRILISLVVMGGLIIARLENIGWNWKWSLLIPVPVFNLFLLFSTYMLPEGYKDTKKLDSTGKIIAVIIFGFFVVMTVWIIIESAG